MTEMQFILGYAVIVTAWVVCMAVLEWWFFHRNDTPR